MLDNCLLIYGIFGGNTYTYIFQKKPTTEPLKADFDNNYNGNNPVSPTFKSVCIQSILIYFFIPCVDVYLRQTTKKILFLLGLSSSDCSSDSRLGQL